MNLFTSENILLEQFLSRRIASDYGERRLLLGVLNDAVASYFRYVCSTNQKKRIQTAELRRWFQSKSMDNLYSFESICFWLDLCADEWRGNILRVAQTKTDLKKIAGKIRVQQRHSSNPARIVERRRREKRSKSSIQVQEKLQ